jgi:hypothetical protein
VSIVSDSSKLPSPGTIIGNYCIGGGGMGGVYEGQDLRLQRRVAIKILPPPLGEEGDELHPNIVSIFHAAFDQDCYYIAMEFIEGKTLRELLEAECERRCLPARPDDLLVAIEGPVCGNVARRRFAAAG